jgi:hypothetical protein
MSYSYLTRHSPIDLTSSEPFQICETPDSQHTDMAQTARVPPLGHGAMSGELCVGPISGVEEKEQEKNHGRLPSVMCLHHSHAEVQMHAFPALHASFMAGNQDSCPSLDLRQKKVFTHSHLFRCSWFDFISALDERRDAEHITSTTLLAGSYWLGYPSSRCLRISWS